MALAVSQCLSRADIVSRQLVGMSWFLSLSLLSTHSTLHCKEIGVSPKINTFLLNLFPTLWT